MTKSTDIGILEFDLDETATPIETFHDDPYIICSGLSQFGCTDIIIKPGNYGKELADDVFGSISGATHAITTLSVATFHLEGLGQCEFYWNSCEQPFSGSYSYQAFLVPCIPMRSQHTLLIALVLAVSKGAFYPFELKPNHKPFKSFDSLKPLLVSGCPLTDDYIGDQIYKVSFTCPF